MGSHAFLQFAPVLKCSQGDIRDLRKCVLSPALFGHSSGSLPAINGPGGTFFAGLFASADWCLRVDSNLNLAGRGKIEGEYFVSDDARPVEGVVEPEIRRKGIVRRGGDDPVFQKVAGLEAKDTHGLDADVLVSGSVDDGGVGVVGDGAGENVGSAAVRVRDVNMRNIDGLEGAVVLEIEAGELAHTKFAIDLHPRMDFLAAVSVPFEADLGFEQFDLRGEFGGSGGRGLFHLTLSGLLRWLLRGFLRAGGVNPRQEQEKSCGGSAKGSSLGNDSARDPRRQCRRRARSGKD